MINRCATCAIIVALAALLVQPAAAESLVAQDLRIPFSSAGPQGLEAVLVKPAGPGRHPLVLVSHGSPRDGDARPGMTARAMLPQLTAFARRGFVAVAVLRRGYGSSGGGWAESFGSCNDPDYRHAGEAAADDLRSAIVVLSRRSDVDSANILAVGVSAGGFATVALTDDPPPGLVAAISFAGGRGSQEPDQVCQENRLVAAFATFGRRSRVPMLWVYADNDHFFGPALAQRLYRAFREAGGAAEFVKAPSFDEDGHTLFSAKGIAIWTPIVDSFLDHGGFVAAPAIVANLAPPRSLGVKGREDFQTFLEAATHKAFAVGPTGAYAWRTARPTTEDATKAALTSCESMGHHPCRIYALDDAYAAGR